MEISTCEDIRILDLAKAMREAATRLRPHASLLAELAMTAEARNGRKTSMDIYVAANSFLAIADFWEGLEKIVINGIIPAPIGEEIKKVI